MACIGDKLLLLFGRPNHGGYGAAGGKADDDIYQNDADGGGDQGKHGGACYRAKLLMAVQKYRHPTVVAHAVYRIAIALRCAVALSVPDGNAQIMRGIVLGHGGNVGQVGFCQRAVVIVEQDEVTGGKRRFGRKKAVLSVVGLLRMRVFRNFSLIVVDHVQHAVLLVADRDVICGVDRNTQQKHHCCDRRHGNPYEFFL